MNTSFFIARRLALNETKIFSSFIIRIAIIAVTLSVAVMIIGSAITRGYQDVIQHKFYDCWGHIHLTTFLADPSNLAGDATLEYDDSLVNQIRSLNGIQSINPYLVQSAIIKTQHEVEGLLMKGVRENQIEQYLITGKSIHFNKDSFSNEILISKITADQLSVHCGDDVIVYLLNKEDQQPRARKVKVIGIYQTGLEDYDKLFAICDMNFINHINKKSKNTIHGYEIFVKHPNEKEVIEKEIYEKYTKPPLQTYLIEKRFANVFSWLGMMKMNERIILIIMMIIAVINMITALLILVLERTQMIGVLKALGMKNRKIQYIFLYSSLYIFSVGLICGTILGIGLSLLQKTFGWIHLNESIYYVRTVPIYLDPSIILGINLLSLIVCALLLIIPTWVIQSISPSKALRFT
jgi:lipoprotein-releasing system permease protein